MQAEPSTPDPPKRKRRRFQFSPRTLLILMAVTALAQPLIIWAWDATQPRIQCADLLKPINVPLVAVGDKAAMQTEPSKAEPPNRKAAGLSSACATLHADGVGLRARSKL